VQQSSRIVAAAIQEDCGTDGVPFRAVGCDECARTGYKGRELIAELLPVEGPVRSAVQARKDSMELMSAAASVGWRGLWARGVEKAAAGLTTYAELRRVLIPAG
jgi:type II secretory ATPase GspE/PulE/Tfp pilus assembly ATPase PilB-like protein